MKKAVIIIAVLVILVLAIDFLFPRDTLTITVQATVRDRKSVV